MRRIKHNSKRTCRPFGFIQDGANDDVFVSDGEVWKTEWEHDRYDRYRDKIDEYGLPMSPWQWGDDGSYMSPNTDWW